MSRDKTSIVFTGDIGFDRYMDRRWEDDEGGALHVNEPMAMKI